LIDLLHIKTCCEIQLTILFYYLSHISCVTAAIAGQNAEALSGESSTQSGESSQPMQTAISQDDTVSNPAEIVATEESMDTSEVSCLSLSC